MKTFVTDYFEMLIAIASKEGGELVFNTDNEFTEKVVTALEFKNITWDVESPVLKPYVH